jgi:hypothetical protein
VEYKAEWWSIDMLPEWEVSEDAECDSFFASPQIGVLQVSAAKKPTGSVTLEDIAEFAYDSKTPREAIRPVSALHASGLYAEYEQAGHYWREWWLKGESVLVFVTYNVALAHKDSERAAVDALISSLRITA